MTMVSTTADQYETSPRAGVNAIHFPTIQFRLFHCLTVCGRNVPRNIATCQQKVRTTRLNVKTALLNVNNAGFKINQLCKCFIGKEMYLTHLLSLKNTDTICFYKKYWVTTDICLCTTKIHKALLITFQKYDLSHYCNTQPKQALNYQDFYS